MLAVRLPAHPAKDAPLVLVEADIPVAGPDEVLIEVHAAGVNRGDLKQRAGDFPRPPTGPAAELGLEVAGVVRSCGATVKRFQPGDRVCALLTGGGYSHFCVAPAAQCLPIPAGLDFTEAACLPEALATVWQTLYMMGNLRAGETALIHGGSSGIGVAAIQLARATGSRVFATAGSPAKCAACEALGAERAVNYREADFADEVMRFTQGRGVDVILDMVGAPYAVRNLACLAEGGRLAYIAGDLGGEVSFGIRDIMVRRLTITGATLRHRSTEDKARILSDLERVAWPLIEQGLIRAVVDRIFPLEQVESAHEHLAAGGVIGKVLLTAR